ncbi:MAG: helix-hairpin-helix domain-containing protein, partial [Acidobacteriota bacterium]|nr:helix-hairpin-helix domain-containing protein [Acidobacteriota bacterium]
TGWKIDIKSEEEKRAEIEDQMALLSARTPLSELPALSPGILAKLTESGIETIEELADTPIADLTDIKGVGPKSAEKIIASVKDYYIQYTEAVEARRAAEAEKRAEEERARREAEAREAAAQAEEAEGLLQASDLSEASSEQADSAEAESSTERSASDENSPGPDEEGIGGS